MNASQQTETRAVTDDPGPVTGDRMPEVRPAVSFWDIREVKESRSAQAARTAVRALTVAVPYGVTAGLVLIAREVMRADGLDGGAKVAGVTAVVLSLVILGMAAILAGAKTHASTAKDDPVQSAQPGDGGTGA